MASCEGAMRFSFGGLFVGGKGMGFDGVWGLPPSVAVWATGGGGGGMVYEVPFFRCHKRRKRMMKRTANMRTRMKASRGRMMERTERMRAVTSSRKLRTGLAMPAVVAVASGRVLARAVWVPPAMMRPQMAASRGLTDPYSICQNH